MKFVIKVAIILVAANVLELFLPWWSIAVAAFIGGALIKSNANFLAGFLAIALLWIFKAWLVDMGSESGLAERVATIFPLQNKLGLFSFTALLGGLVGGFAALTGSFLVSWNRQPANF